MAFIVMLCGGCSPPSPTLNAIVPNTGYPRQLLAVDGTTQFGSIVWDPGPSEQVFYNGVFGTSYFQIPKEASPGAHAVAIRNSNGTSGTVQVNVLELEDFRDDPTETKPFFPAPRIEDITAPIVAGNGPINLVLTVAAANLDVDATLTVSEIVGASAPVDKPVTYTDRWGALPIDYLQTRVPRTFGYPVYHYAQLISVVENVTLGSKLQVTVHNTDGKTGTREFPVPSSLSNWDGDGDGLLDAWEEDAYPAPSGAEISLADMGADKWRKDVLVEVDWIAVAEPHVDLWTGVEQAFADAPVLNPNGARGVNIIIDHGQTPALSNGGQTLADHDCLSFANPPPLGVEGCMNLQSFFGYKATNFDPDRLAIFHYAIFGRGDLEKNSGRGERHGNDFFVTILGSGAPNFLGAQVGTFVHELGHNLGFSHGNLVTDDQNFPFKPNLPSVMGALYAVLGVDLDCDMIGDGVYTYSQGTLRQIDEADLNETVGVCDGVAVDMNGDGDTLDVGAVNLNEGDEEGQDHDTIDRWDDFDQWGNMLLDFDAPGSDWGNN